jgi:hypothetical protein
VITASGGVVIADTDDDAVGAEAPIGTVGPSTSSVDAEPLPAAPDADPAIGEANPS